MKTMSDEGARHVGYVAAVINVSSALLIIPANKWLFRQYKFRWVILLSFVHYLSTFLLSLLIVAVRQRRAGSESVPDNAKAVPAAASFRQYALPGMLGVGVIAASNMSLASNSLSIYQLCKMGVTPGTVLAAFLMYGRKSSVSELCSIALMSVGLALAVGVRADLQLTGMVYAVTGVACVCVQVVMLGELQRANPSHTPEQISLAMIPPQLVFLLTLAVSTEPCFPWQENSVFSYAWTREAAFFCAATTALAVTLKLSGLWVLGVFNAVTTTLLGYFKTVVVLLIGILLFGDEWNATILLGLAMFFSGAAWYKFGK
jgi:solute carrier family 35 protein E3